MAIKGTVTLRYERIFCSVLLESYTKGLLSAKMISSDGIHSLVEFQQRIHSTGDLHKSTQHSDFCFRFPMQEWWGNVRLGNPCCFTIERRVLLAPHLHHSARQWFCVNTFGGSGSQVRPTPVSLCQQQLTLVFHDYISIKLIFSPYMFGVVPIYHILLYVFIFHV